MKKWCIKKMLTVKRINKIKLLLSIGKCLYMVDFVSLGKNIATAECYQNR
jgi:hypothetical protein